MIKSKLFQASINCIVACCFVSNLVNGETYTSVEELKKLIETQKSVIQALESYITQEMERLADLDGYLDILKYEQMKAVANVQKYIGNPVNCFLLIKRLTTDRHFIIELTNKKTEFLVDPEPTYPSWEDLTGAALSVARLQQVYQLDVNKLANGVVTGSFSSNRSSHSEKFTPMSSSDCYELGRVLYEQKNYLAAKDWLLEAYARTDPEDAERFPMAVVMTVESLCYIFIELNDMDSAHKWVKKLLELAPEDELTLDVRRALEKKSVAEDREGTKEAPPDEEKYGGAMKDYEKLCRGEMDVPPDIEHRLHCKYSMDNPYLKLAPIKTEQLYKNPDIYMFYDVVSDSEIEKIKSIGISKLERSKVKGKVTRVDDSSRISMVAWLEADVDLAVENMYKRIEAMTGLSTIWAEKLQLAVYVPGGFYLPHYDYIEPVLNNSKERYTYRMATVMFYFSDVKQGGATVFTKIGLTVFPVKGAALFWYNVHNSGAKHNNTIHAACPVLLGHKWAANVWIHCDGQEFSHPCQIDDKMDESFVPAVWRLNKSEDVLTRHIVEPELKLQENKL